MHPSSPAMCAPRNAIDDTLRRLVEDFPYPNAIKALMAEKLRTAPPTQGPSRFGRMADYDDDAFEGLFDDLMNFFYENSCWIDDRMKLSLASPPFALPLPHSSVLDEVDLSDVRLPPFDPIDPFDLSDEAESVEEPTPAFAPVPTRPRAATLTRQESSKSFVTCSSDTPSLSVSVGTSSGDEVAEVAEEHDQSAEVASTPCSSPAVREATPDAEQPASATRPILPPISFTPASAAPAPATLSSQAILRAASLSQPPSPARDLFKTLRRVLAASKPLPKVKAAKPPRPSVMSATFRGLFARSPPKPDRAAPVSKAVAQVSSYKLKRQPIAHLPFYW